MKRFKNLSLVLALAMVLQILMPVNFAYAATGNDITTDVEGIIDGIKGTVTIKDPITKEEIYPEDDDSYKDVPDGAEINIKYDFRLPVDDEPNEGDEYHFKEGDYFEFDLPEGIDFEQPFTGSILDEGNKKIADYTLEGNKVKVVFTNYVEDEDDVSGYFDITGSLSKSAAPGGGSDPINIKYVGEVSVSFKDESQDPEADVNVAKTGLYDPVTGEIIWTIKVNTDEPVEGVSIVDTIVGDNHSYIPDTFTVVTGSAITQSAVQVNGKVLKYEFSGAISGEQIFTFKTKPTTGSAFAVESTAVFKNNVRAEVKGKPGKDFPAEVSLEWIFKKGKLLDNGIIEWEISINKKGHTIKDPVITDTIPAGLELVDDSVYLKLPGGEFSKLDDSEYNCTNGATVKDTSTLEYEHTGNITGEAVLKYQTKIVDMEFYQSNQSKSFKNSADLTWEGNVYGKPWDKASVSGVGTGGIINKSAGSKVDYDGEKTNTIKWKVEINKNQISIDNAVFVDNIPKELKYVDGSFTILPDTDQPSTGFSYTPALDGSEYSGTLKFEFSGTIDETYTIEFKTEIIDHERLFGSPVEVGYTNAATLTGSGITGNVQTGSGTQKFNSQVIAKSVLTDYNYETREVEWKIVINRNKMELNNAVLTDDIPQGMEYVDGSFSITPTPGAIAGQPELSDDGSKLTYNFGKINDTYTVKFKTKVTDEGLAEIGSVEFKNEAALTANGWNPVKSQAAVTVKNPIVEKQFEYANGDDFVKWIVPINTNSIKLENVKLFDKLKPYLRLDTDSVNLYHMTVDSENNYAKGDPVDEDEYIVGYSTSTNIFTFEFKNTIDSPYRLEFITDVLQDKVKVENTIEFKGQGITGENTDSSTSVQVNQSSSGGGGTTEKLTVFKTDEKGNKLEGAEIRVYRLVIENGKEVEYRPVEDVTDEDGEVVFDRLLYKTYYVREIKAPDGYLLNAEPQRVKITKDKPAHEITIINSIAKDDIAFNKYGDLGPLQGAKFELFAEDEEGKFTKSMGTATSEGDDGIVLFENIEAGSYQIREIEAPKGYKISTDLIDVTVGTDETQTEVVVTLTIDGEPMDNGFKNELVELSAPIVLYKKGVDKKNNEKFDLAGAEFTLYEYIDGGAGDQVGQPAISGADGKVSFANVPLGTYVVKETGVPNGYAKSEPEQEVFVNIFRNPEELDKAVVEYRFDNIEGFGSEQLTVENEKLFADITFTKVDESGEKGLAGAEFKLTKKDPSDWGSKIAVSDEYGKVTFEHIEFGDYIIEETKAPTGYVELTDKIYVTVGYNEDKTDAVAAFTINNEGMQYEEGKVYVGNELVDVYAKAVVNKGYEFGKALTGAVFGIFYEDSDEPLQSVVEKDGQVIFEELSPGSYVIRELSAPDGYLISTGEIFVEVYRNSEKLDEALTVYMVGDTEFTPDIPTVENKAIILELMKTDKSGDPLEGAEFTLYDGQGNAVEGFGPVTSNDFGEVIFTAVPAGSYIIKETKAPSGYRDYDKEINVTVEVNNDNEAVITFTIDGEVVELADEAMLTVENEKRPGGGGGTPAYGKIAIKKVDEDKKVLEGAEFTLYDSKGKVVGKAVSGKDGIVSFEKLEKGSYVIKETKAPEGYVLEVNETEVEIKGSETKTYTFTNKKEEPKKPGRIEIIKTDEEGNLLPDAWFSLIDEKGSTLQNVVTVNGRAVFEDVPAGRYTVKEVQAPAGYELDGKAVSVTVGSEETITVKFVNKLSGVPVVPVNGKIIINKVDENNMALSGAEFTLYNDNNEVLGTAVSDANGRVVFENLKDGKYYVKETKAPEGYEIVTDALTVDVAQGKSYSYRFRNVPASEIIRDPNVPKGWETIDDPDVPADTVPTLPNTGSFLNTWILAAIGFMFIGTGLLLSRKKRIRN